MGRSAVARIVAALLGVACLWGPLAALTHAVNSRHIVCAEHGDLMEAPVEAVHPAEPLDDQAALHSGADGVGGGAHEHCGFALYLRHQVGTTRSATAAQPIALQVTSGHGFDFRTPAAPQVHLYRLAPKTSPPA